MNASTTVLGTMALAILAVVVDPIWLRAGRLITLVHETGHTLTLLLSGRWIKEIVLNRSGGHTAHEGGTLFWPADVLITFTGYAAPPVAGLFLALGVGYGWNPRTVLATLLILLVGAVLLHGNWLGLAVMVAIGLVFAFFLWEATATAQIGMLVALAWLLLLGGLRRTVEIAGQPTANSDMSRLASLTSLHQNVWAVVYLTIAIATLVSGARALLY